MKISHMFVIAAAVLFAFTLVPQSVSAQRDYFTDAEVDLVRDAQDIDLRIKVLTHAIDRRLAVLQIVPGTGKESDKWGPPPTGTRSQLLSDIKRILQKAVDDIDDTAAHAGTKGARTIENPTKKDKSDPPFTRALRELSSAAARYKPLFQAELDKSTDRSADGPLLDAVDLCDQILESIGKGESSPAKN